MENVIFNGKFLSANMTGVHRVAEALLNELNKMPNEDNPLDSAEVYGPHNMKRELAETDYPHRRVGKFTGPMWEQFELPRYAHKKLLVNFCNLAPLFSKNSITMIHDAQVYLTPKSYSALFKAWYKLALPMIGRRHKRILTVSEFSKSQLVKYGVAPEGKISVVHNGVDHMLDVEKDTSILKRLGLENKSYFCALSNTQEHKNIPLLFDVMRDQALAEKKLVLIGGTSRSDFEKTGANIPSNVVFSGRVTDGEMRSLIEGANCYLFPSTTEGFGLPPLESMILGTPAIVAPEGALPEVCQDAALYANATDPQEWVNQILALQSDDFAYQALSEKGKGHAENFTWHSAAEKVMAVIKDVSLKSKNG